MNINMMQCKLQGWFCRTR